jgi:hypothetical protein
VISLADASLGPSCPENGGTSSWRDANTSPWSIAISVDHPAPQVLLSAASLDFHSDRAPDELLRGQRRRPGNGPAGVSCRRVSESHGCRARSAGERTAEERTADPRLRGRGRRIGTNTYLTTERASHGPARSNRHSRIHLTPGLMFRQPDVVPAGVAAPKCR